LFPKLCQRLFAKALPHSKSIPKRHMDLMADDLSYRQYVKFLIKKMSSGAIKMLLRW
jgi:menaquinone-9 beta-reductase